MIKNNNWKINNSYNGTLIDAVKRNQEHPDTFLVEDENKLQSLAVGDFVKIGLEHDDPAIYGERFWVEICYLDLDKKELIGRVDNNLFDEAFCLNYQDYIRLSFANIMYIMPNDIS